jgi:hypothetical protein
LAPLMAHRVIRAVAGALAVAATLAPVWVR